MEIKGKRNRSRVWMRPALAQQKFNNWCLPQFWAGALSFSTTLSPQFWTSGIVLAVPWMFTWIVKLHPGESILQNTSKQVNSRQWRNVLKHQSSFLELVEVYVSKKCNCLQCFLTLMWLTESLPKMSYLQYFRTKHASIIGKYPMQHIFISGNSCQNVLH